MDRTELAVRHMLAAIDAPLYDVGVLSSRGMLPGLNAIPASAVLDKLRLLKFRNARGSHIYLRPSGEHRYTVLDDLDQAKLARLATDGFEPCAVVETSSGNFQAWLKHTRVLPKLLGTFAAQTLAARYGADPSAADWRRFGRLPGFTNCKPKYKQDNGLFPFVRLHSHSGQEFRCAEAFMEEITAAYDAREREREQRRAERVLSPRKGPRFLPSLERFRTASKYTDRPAQRTSLSVLLLTAVAWTRPLSSRPLPMTTSPGTQALPHELPTSGAPWARPRVGWRGESRNAQDYKGITPSSPTNRD